MASLKRKTTNVKRRVVGKEEMEKKIANRICQKVITAEGGEKELAESVKMLNIINVVINYLKPEDAKWLESVRAAT